MNRTALLFISVLLVVSSCTQKRYGHLTSFKPNKSKTEQVKKYASPAHMAIDLRIDRIQFNLQSVDRGVLKILEDKRTKEFSKLKQLVQKEVRKSAVPLDIKRIKSTPRSLKERSAEESVAPKQTQGIGEVFGILLLMAVLSFLAAAIATIFGMAYWKAFWTFFVVSSLLIILGSQMDG